MDLHEVPQTSFRRHPWEVARARFFGRQVAAAVEATGRPARVLDVGAGDGYLARALLDLLPPTSSVACVDPHYTDHDLQRFATPATVGLSFSRARPAGPFDVVLMLDVIEHVADDRAFVTEILAGGVAPDALVLVSVPAWDLLYGKHDLALKHFRRYQPAQCRALLQSVGLRIIHGGGLFHSLLLPRVLQRLGDAVRGTLAGGEIRYQGGPRDAGRGAADDDDHPANLGEWRGGDVVSKAVTWALDADAWLSERLARAGRDVPGLSYWALCRKEAGPT